MSTYTINLCLMAVLAVASIKFGMDLGAEKARAAMTKEVWDRVTEECRKLHEKKIEENFKKAVEERAIDIASKMMKAICAECKKNGENINE